MRVSVRVGVGRPPEGWDTADYVLGRWSTDEREELTHVVDTAANAVEAVLRDGLDAAMNLFNVRARGGRSDAEQSLGAQAPSQEQ